MMAQQESLYVLYQVLIQKIKKIKKCNISLDIFPEVRYNHYMMKMINFNEKV